MAEKRRIYMLDELRGFAIICMIFHHTLLDFGDVLHIAWGYTAFNKLCSVQPLFWAIFIVISGICSRLSRNTLKRGLLVLGCALVITLVTAVFMPMFGFIRCEIYFGILHCLGACMVITGLLMPLINRINYKAGAAVSLVLFAIFYEIENKTLLFGLIKLPDALYKTNALVPLGLHGSSFFSADYFPIIPWIFMFLFGAFFGKLAKEEELPEFMYKRRLPFLCTVGKNSLWIYLAHQPIIYILMFAAAHLISLF